MTDPVNIEDGDYYRWREFAKEVPPSNEDHPVLVSWSGKRYMAVSSAAHFTAATHWQFIKPPEGCAK